LATLDSHALVDDQLGILFENSLFHNIILSVAGLCPAPHQRNFLKKVPLETSKTLIG